jgi:hypothetical protein
MRTGRPIEQDTRAMSPIVMPDTGNVERSEPDAVTKGLERAMRSICAIEGVGSKAGTGTLIGPDLVLTNYHVVDRLIGNNADFEGAECRFDYRIVEGHLLEANGAQTIFKIREVVIFSPPSPGDIRGGGDVFDDDKLDFAIVRLDGQPGRLPDAERNIRGWIALPWKKDVADPDIGLEVCILQHPYEEGGAAMLQPLKSDYTEFVDARSDPARGAAGALARYVHEGATRRGSSGGPCFSTTYGFVLIAIHNASLDGDGGDARSRGQAIPLRRICGFIERRTNQPGNILGRAAPKDLTADAREQQRAVSIDRRKKAALCLMDRSSEENEFLATLFAAASDQQAPRPLLHVVVCREDDAHTFFMQRLSHLSFETKQDSIDRSRLEALTKGLNPPSRNMQIKAWPQQNDIVRRRKELSTMVRLLDATRSHLLVLSRTIDATWTGAGEEPLLSDFAAMLAQQFQPNPDRIQAVVFFIVMNGQDTEALARQFAGLWSSTTPPHCGVCVELSRVGLDDLEEWRAYLENAWAANDAFSSAIRSQFDGARLKPLDAVAKGLNDSLSKYIADTLDRAGLLKESSP